MQSKAKNSLFIGPLPPPLGGVAVINQSLQAIDYDGYKVTAFNTSNHNDREDLYSAVSIASVFSGIKKLKAIKKTIEAERPAVINLFVTSGVAILREILYLVVIAKYRIPIIIHFHSKTHGEFALKPWRLKIVAWFFNKFAAKIIVLSPYHLKFFIQFFDKPKCMVLENFVNYADYENDIVNKNDDFLFVGRLTVEKGFFDLLYAVLLLKQRDIACHIHVIGVAATDAQEQEIHAFVKKHGLESYFTFHGAVFGEKKYQLFRQSSCLLFPSHFENSPVVLKEAIAAKMAMISSNIQANVNVLDGKDNHLLFKKGCVENLTESIEMLLNNKEQTEQYCKVSESIKYYDVNIAQTKLTSLFDELTQ